MGTEGWDVANRALKRLRAGLPVWWKRQAFDHRGNYSSTPVWHALATIEIPEQRGEGLGERLVPAVRLHTYTYRAVCGYKFGFDAILGRKPDLKEEVKTKKLRCAKCDAKLAKGQNP